MVWIIQNFERIREADFVTENSDQTVIALDGTYEVVPSSTVFESKRIAIRVFIDRLNRKALDYFALSEKLRVELTALEEELLKANEE